jgi:hypothetical protein
MSMATKPKAATKGKPPRSKKGKAAPGALPAPATDPNHALQVPPQEGKTDKRRVAEIVQSPIHANASTARVFSRGTFGDSGITEMSEVLRDKAAKVKRGDLSDMEAMLVAQATALDSIFTELVRRAALNMGEYIDATDTYMRLGLKAQSQCRATVEALAEIKNPRPVAFVKQANIANGPQQVNNGTPAGEPHAHGKTANQSNELLTTGAGAEPYNEAMFPSYSLTPKGART